MKLQRTLLTIAAVFGLAASASAVELAFTFDTGAQNFQNFAWSSTGPAGWSGGPSIQAPATVGGWTLGGSFNYYHEFDWASGQQPIMQTLVAGGLGRVSFDVILDGTSFPVNDGTWYSINVAGNSAGAHGWTQVDNVTPLTGWRNAGDTSLVSTHVVLSFAQLGWNDPEDATGWFQIYFGANSSDSPHHPVNFYIDNVMVVPEPTTLALAGLGAAALLIRRRRD